jgi:glucose-1-phosphate cytidylyltransferase
MKVVILAGGLGTRMGDETQLTPKPLVKIGNFPIIWHIMKMYSSYGFNDFIICLGYKGEIMKDYFLKYVYNSNNFTLEMKNNRIILDGNTQEDWKIKFVETGTGSMTGYRIKKIKEYVGENFLLAYGDAVSNVDINKLIEFHYLKNATLTMTTVQPKGRFGTAEIDNTGRVLQFREKIQDDFNHWVNGGFFVCRHDLFDYISDEEDEIFEQSPIQRITKEGKLYAFQHFGFWQCMDTPSDKDRLNKMWHTNPEWKVW